MLVCPALCRNLHLFGIYLLCFWFIAHRFTMPDSVQLPFNAHPSVRSVCLLYCSSCSTVWWIVGDLGSLCYSRAPNIQVFVLSCESCDGYDRCCTFRFSSFSSQKKKDSVASDAMPCLLFHYFFCCSDLTCYLHDFWHCHWITSSWMMLHFIFP
jgi:hypothetical protein